MFNVPQQIVQSFNLLFLYTPLRRVLWKLNLFGVVLLVFGFVISIDWMFFLAAPLIAAASLVFFVSFHGQLFWVAGNRQLSMMSAIQRHLLISYVAVVVLVACSLILFEIFFGKGGLVHLVAAISLSIVFNCVALSIAYFSPLVIPFFWVMVIIKSGEIWQVALAEVELLAVAAGATMTVLLLNWKKWMAAALRRKTPALLSSDSRYWRAFFRRYITLLSEYNWRPHSLLGSLLLGRADNPWRGVLGLTAIFLLLWLFSGVISSNTETWFQEDMLRSGINMAIAVWMIGSPQFLIHKIYTNLSRLWLVFPGERNCFFLYLERCLLEEIAKNCFVIGVFIAIAILLGAGLLQEPIDWAIGLSILIGLVLLQCLYFYLSLWIYLRTEADHKWFSTVSSILIILIISSVSFVSAKVEANHWDFSIVAVTTLSVLVLSVGALRFLLVSAWHKVSFIRRGY